MTHITLPCMQFLLNAQSRPHGNLLVQPIGSPAATHTASHLPPTPSDELSSGNKRISVVGHVPPRKAIQVLWYLSSPGQEGFCFALKNIFQATLPEQAEQAARTGDIFAFSGWNPHFPLRTAPGII